MRNKVMKKWWIETSLPDGKIFKGWVNTTAKSKEDFPDMLYGKAYIYDDHEGFHGYFILDGQSEEEAKENYQFVIKYGVFNKPLDFGRPPINSFEAETVLKSLEPINDYKTDRYEFRLEDNIKLENTYIDKY